MEMYLEKAMGVYDKMADKYPSLKSYAILQQGNLAFAHDKNALAQSKWLAVIDLLQDKADRDETDNSSLKTAYRSLGGSIWADKGIKEAAPYLDRLVELDPEYTIAKRYMEAINK